MNDKREFTGVWIPKHIIEDKKLKPVDRLIYAEISCFEVCTMTNATLSDRAGCSEDTASRSVGRLKEKGYIKIIGFNGRVRKMQSQHIAPPQNAEAASAKAPKLPPQNKAQDNNIDNKEITGIAKAIGETPKTDDWKSKLNPDINEMFEYWASIVGYEISGRRQANRNACNNLLKKYKKEGLTKLINTVAVAQREEFAPKVSDFAELQEKINKLVSWGKRSSKPETDNDHVIINGRPVHKAFLNRGEDD